MISHEYEELDVRRMFQGLWGLTSRELKKWMKEPIILFLAIVQPIMWMILFGKSMNLGSIFSSTNLNSINIPEIMVPGDLLNPPISGVVNIPGYVISSSLRNLLEVIGAKAMESVFGVSDYFSYLAVGMVSMITIFTSTFTGMSIVWDRRLGFLYKVLSTPVPRSAIILSKVLNAAIRSIFQSTIILGLAVLLGVKFSSTFSLLNLLSIYLAIFLFSTGLSSLFLAFALRSTRHETQMAIVNLFTMPLMFTSNAFFPVSMMPNWLQAIAIVNPVSYMTDIVRQLTIYQTDLTTLFTDLAYLGLFAISLSTLGIILAWKYLVK
ncbi:MAG: ABC transporter permease [Nitrososphaerota archaeon]